MPVVLVKQSEADSFDRVSASANGHHLQVMLFRLKVKRKWLGNGSDRHALLLEELETLGRRRPRAVNAVDFDAVAGGCDVQVPIPGYVSVHDARQSRSP